MAEAVDSIIAELILKSQGYVEGFDKATAAHGRFTTSIDKLKGQSFDLSAEAQKYKAGLDAVSGAEEQATAKVTRTRKARADTAKASADVEVAAAKRGADAVVASEKAKTDAVAEGARRRRQLEITSGVATQSSGFAGGRNPFQAAADAAGRGGNSTMNETAAILAAKEAGTVQAEVEREINYAKLDQFDIARRIAVADGATKAELAQQLDFLRRIDAYKRAGLTESEAQLRADREIALAQAAQAEASALRAKAAAGSNLDNFGKNALRFGEGAGLGRSYGSKATVAGIGVALTAGAVIEGASTAIDYAKQIRDTAEATSLTTRQVQIYSAAAKQAGVTTEQFQSGIARLNDNLGKAKLGDQQAAKTFAALGINLKTAGSAADVLPTIIDRLSSIADPAKRAAVETRLFGEEGRKLDALLSGGNQKINDLADALIKTGAVLSSSDIEKLDETSKKLAAVKAQLEVDLAQVVAGNATAITSLASAIGTLAGEVLKFLGTNPGAALGIIGALSGGAVGGLPGAAIGSLAGYAAGDRLDRISANQNTDVKFRQAQLKAAQDDLAAISGKGSANDTHFLGLTFHSTNSRTPAGGSIASAQAEVDRQQKLLADAQAKAKADAAKPDQDAFNKTVQAGQANAAKLASLFAPKGPKGKSAETLAKEAEERQKRFNDELADANARYLKAANELAIGTEAQYKIQTDAVETERNKRDADYRSQEKTKQLDGGKAKELIAANDAAAQEQLKVLALHRQVEAYNAAADVVQKQYAFQAEILGLQSAFADTTKKRLELAQQQIVNERQAAASNAVKTILSPDPKVTDEQRAAAKTDLRNLTALTNARDAAAKRQNETPGQTYARSLQINSDTIPSEEVKILETFNKGLDQSIDKALKLHGIFGEIVGDLIDMVVKQGLIAPLANALFPTTGGAGAAASGGIFGSIFSGIGSLFGGGFNSASALSGVGSGLSFDSSSALAALPGLATGGVIGGNGGVDRNILSINNQPVARVGKGEMLSISPNGSANTQAASPQPAPTVIQQNITYSGAVDIADKGYVNAMGAALYSHTQQAITQSGKDTLAATPAYSQRNSQLK